MKYVKRPFNRIITDENKVPFFKDRKVKLQPGQAVLAIFRMKMLNSLSDKKQVCLGYSTQKVKTRLFWAGAFQ